MKSSALLVSVIALVLVSAIAGAVLYDRMPDRVPIHFDISGHPNGYAPRPVGAFMTPVMLLLTGILLLALPRISPNGYRLEPFQRSYEIICVSILVMVFVIGTTALLFAAGYRLDVTRITVGGVGLLFLILGNFMGKLTRNFMIGIRTPWTLASDEVWRRTHRVGGFAFVACGAMLLIASLVAAGRATSVMLALVIAMAAFLIVYSYVIYRRVEH